jgi:hypothetical protein
LAGKLKSKSSFFKSYMTLIKLFRIKLYKSVLKEIINIFHFQLVLAAANRYQTVFNIQMAATACLFNLSKSEIGQRLHPKVLGRIVKVDLVKINFKCFVSILISFVLHLNIIGFYILI